MAKSEYKFKCDENVAKEIINQFLKANGYKEKTSKEGKVYYQYSDAMCIGFLEYEIEGGEVKVYAYLRSEKKPMPLDDSFVGALPKSYYKDKIQPLLKALSNPGELNSKIGEAIGEEEPKKEEINPVSSEKEENKAAYNQFENESNKSKEKYAVVAFVISIIGLVLSCFGFIYGFLIIFLEFYFAIQGLKTKKKGLAITAIVLASISLLINILTIIVAYLMG